MFGNSALKKEIAQIRDDFKLDIGAMYMREEKNQLVIAELQKQIKKLKKHLKVVDATLLPYGPPKPESFFGNVPLHVSELEEDAQYKLDAGFINESEFEEILAEAGLDPRIEIHTS